MACQAVLSRSGGYTTKFKDESVKFFFLVIAFLVSTSQLVRAEGSPNDQGVSGVVSDRFDLRWELDSNDLLLSIDTDLPDEDRLSIRVYSIYWEVGNQNAYSREYFQKSELVSRWRKPRRISLDSNAWKADLEAHQKDMARIPDLAFEVGRIDENVIISVAAWNSNKKTFEAEAIVPFPLGGPPPELRSYVSLDNLRRGESYRFSGEVPLMPELDPTDALAAIEGTLYLPPGTTVQILAVNRTESRPWPWYKVKVVKNQVAGWINAAALLRQEIERVQ